ncbi:MAG: hypothetical protein HUU56_08815 [Bdellovibrionaceae bacterium]|nr:hypothetical protein [Pseudobdellovibrionaceae bacterium]
MKNSKFFIFLSSIFLIGGIFFSHTSLGSEADSEVRPKMALSLYHWNIQYVSGDANTEDAIVREAFIPTMKLYSNHPSWHGTFELQGYMIEVLEKRFPEALVMLKQLVKAKQIELISNHYSDQFVLAYPAHDQVKSLEINNKIFRKHQLDLAPIVFMQEDQFGVGIAEFMKKQGYKQAVIMSGWNQFSNLPDAPYFQFHGLDILIGSNPKGPYWVFKGDAELAVTGKANNPYFAYLGINSLFKTSTKSIQELSNEMLNYEKQGIKIVTISEYFSTVKRQNLKPAVAADILDKMRGNFTNNVWLWMGDNRNIFAEDDIKVRSINYESRNWLLAAETAFNKLLKKTSKSYSKKLHELSNFEELWKLQLKAEVSDATGLGLPFPIEVKTSLQQSEEVIRISKEILTEILLSEGKSSIQIDTKSKHISFDLEEKYFEGGLRNHLPLGKKNEFKYKLVQGQRGIIKQWQNQDNEGPLPVIFTGSGNHLSQWSQLDNNFWKLQIFWYPTIPQSLSINFQKNGIVFPFYHDIVEYSPALLEDQIKEYPLSMFTFEKIYLPLSNGLIGIGNQFYIIKENISNHVAVKLEKNVKTVTFETRNPPMKKNIWSFYVFRGDKEEALKWAQRINTHPRVKFSLQE